MFAAILHHPKAAPMTPVPMSMPEFLALSYVLPHPKGNQLKQQWL